LAGIPSEIPASQLAEMSDGERYMLLKCLMTFGKDSEAVSLYSQYPINDPTLVTFALANRCEELALLLIEGNEHAYLSEAVRCGCLRVVARIIPNAEFDAVALCMATKNKEMLQLFLEHHAAVNDAKWETHAPLSYATKYKYTESIDLLLAAGADPHLGNPSALTLAIAENNHALIKKFLEHGGLLFERDASGEYPFIKALFINDPIVIQMLLDHPDCRLDIVSLDGKTPLGIAIYTGNRALAEGVSEKGLTLQDGDDHIVSHAIKRAIEVHDTEQLYSILRWTKNHPIALSSLLENADFATIKEVLSKFPELQEPEGLLDFAAKTVLTVGPKVALALNLDLEMVVRRIIDLQVDWKAATGDAFSLLIMNYPEESKDDFVKKCFNELVNPKNITATSPSGDVVEILFLHKPENFTFDPCLQTGGRLFGTSPLKAAVSQGNESLVRELLNHSTNKAHIQSLVTAKDTPVNTLLREALE
jgi:hypothetical protein